MTHTADADGNYTSFGFICDTGTAAYDVNKINAYLRVDERSISATGVKLDAPVGSHQSPVYGREFNFGSGRRITEEQGVFVSHLKDDGEDHDVEVLDGHTRIIDFDSLPNDGTNYYIPTPAERPRASIIRVAGKTAAVTANIEDYQGLAGKVNNAKPFEIHNHNTAAAGLVHLVDGAGDNIVTLRPGQHGDFVSSFNPDGTGRLIGHVPKRKAEFTGLHSLGYIDDSPYYNYQPDTDYWIRLLRLDEDAASRDIDTDAFTVGDGDGTDGQSLTTAFTTLTDGFIDIEKDGALKIVSNVSLVPESDATGSHPKRSWFQAGAPDRVNNS